MATRVKTGFESQTDQPRYHFDLYAVLESGQELYFGHETQVNVNVVETVNIRTKANEDIEKCYMAPPKRRGVERRVLIWAPVGNGFLGDRYNCGIPHTCSQKECPICRVYGGLITKAIEIERDDNKTEKREATTLIGRLTHGGGTAIQALDPSEKQRAMHPSHLRRNDEENPMPFKREYNQPGLLYPVYNHCLSVTESEFSAVVYAFLGSLARLGAGNPKGAKILEQPLTSESDEPWIVLDRYLTPLGKRPVVSPAITDINAALSQFKNATFSIGGRKQEPSSELTRGSFHRYVGDAAIAVLSDYLERFEKEVLNRKEAENVGY